jgi:adenylate/guanylate cyclase
MRNFKKILIYLGSSLITALLFCTLYIFTPNLADNIGSYFRDTLFKIRGEIENSNEVVIVDIDEHSIKRLGQWPWSRDKLSKIVENLTNAGALIIGFDIVFAEPDAQSPSLVFDKFNLKIKNAINYDEIFAAKLQNSPVVLGYQFKFDNIKDQNQTMPENKVIVIEKNKGSEKFIIEATSAITNIPILQNSSYSSGFFNNIPDNSGIIHSVPLVISYNDIIYPSLALEIIRLISSERKITINYSQDGINDISIGDLIIPTDRFGRLLVNFRGNERNFAYISADQIYDNKFDKSLIKDKIILIGTSAAGLLDMRATPFDTIFPGVEVHANVIDNILIGDFISKAPWIDGVNIAIIILVALIVPLFSLFSLWLSAILFISLIFGYIYGVYVMLFSYGYVIDIVFVLLTIITSFMVTILINYFYSIKKEETIRAKFALKVSKDVMNDLLSNADLNKFKATKREISVFFSDIRNFTTIAEQMNDSAKLISYLNSYLEPMSNIIIRHKGTIDKYIGDSIMAYYNAPLTIDNHADMAVISALEQIKELEILNQNLKKDNLPIIKIGIGINTGKAVIGEIGSHLRSDYTTIGDTVNIASRLESLSKTYGSIINITNYTKEQLKNNYTIRFVDKVQVKGKSKAIEVWEVISDNEPSIELKSELTMYEKAINFYKNMEFLKALELFSQLSQNSVLDATLYKLYYKRCNDLLNQKS